jgi:hypothetical protein
MAAPKRPSGNAGKGRRKGVPNKISAALKDMILGALNDAGGQQYLVEQARENPVAFLTLIGKVLPMQIAGDPAEPLQISWIRDSEADGRKQ